MGGEAVEVISSSPSEVIQMGAKTVAAAGIAEPLTATPTRCYDVLIQCKKTNTGSIFIGGAGVTNSGSAGIELLPVSAGVQPLSIELSAKDLHLVFINASVNGDGVNFIYW